MAELSTKPRLQPIGLNDLPDEILTQIIQDDVLFFHLFPLTLCSRRLCGLTEPFLYSKFRQESSQSLPSFSARLLARPDLAFQTKLFSVKVPREEEQELDFAKWNKDDWTRSSSAVRAASLDGSQATRWTNAIMHKSWDALVALTLLLMPNLEELVFLGWGNNNTAENTRHILEVLDRASDLQIRNVPSQYAMSNLRKVHPCYSGGYGGMTFDDLEPFIRLKSVNSLEATRIHDERHNRGANNGPRDLGCNIQYLRINHSFISHMNIVNRFRRLPKVRKLSYSFNGYLAFKPSSILDAIGHLKPCLEELQVLRSNRQHYHWRLEGCPIGSLVDFEALVFIDMQATVLIGERPLEEEDGADSPKVSGENHEMGLFLPPSLKYLSIRDCKPWHVSSIFELVNHSVVNTPLLKKLDLYWERTKPRNEPALPGLSKHEGFSENEAEDLLSACEQAGITMIITS